MTGVDKMKDPEIQRDASGRPTGIIDSDQVGGRIRNAAGFLKNLPKDIFESSSLTMLRDLNRSGLTASGGACQFEDIYRQWQKQGRLSMRFFCLRTAGGGGAGGLNLGSIQTGRLADMVVLDRDYLTIPADDIKNIRPVMTIVGGRVVYDSAATP
jgi:predicted amidohydrolase YtcJ